jgi:hypothetical protein
MLDGYRNMVGYEGKYLINDEGNIFSLRRKKPIKLRKNAKGYLIFSVYFPEGKRKIFAHRAVLEAFVGPRPDRHICRHKDGNPSNNHVSNLEWGTYRQNEADKILHGTVRKGSMNSQARITEEIALQIANANGSQLSIAARFGVGRFVVRGIKSGDTWGWLTGVKSIKEAKP